MHTRTHVHTNIHTHTYALFSLGFDRKSEKEIKPEKRLQIILSKRIIGGCRSERKQEEIG